MSSHDHHDSHSDEPKAVSFTVPFILASVTLVIMFSFLSLCDPKKHHGGGHGHSEHSEMGSAGHEEHNADAKEDHVESEDTMAVETAAPSADEAHAATTATAASTQTAPATEAHH